MKTHVVPGRSGASQGGERVGRRQSVEGSSGGQEGRALLMTRGAASRRQVPSGCGQGGSLRPHDFGESRVSSRRISSTRENLRLLEEPQGRGCSSQEGPSPGVDGCSAASRRSPSPWPHRGCSCLRRVTGVFGMWGSLAGFSLLLQLNCIPRVHPGRCTGEGPGAVMHSCFAVGSGELASAHCVPTRPSLLPATSK